MLEQLPNGDWIDLREVVGLRMLPRSARQGNPSPAFSMHPPRVCIDLRSHASKVVDFEMDGDAEMYRDELAQKCNQARQNTISGKEERNPKTA